MELAVLANLAIGFHEQTRLQPQIREALDAGYATKEDLGQRALEALFPSAARLWPVVRRPAAAVGRRHRSRRAARDEQARARGDHGVVDGSVAAGTGAGARHAPRRHVPGGAPRARGRGADRAAGAVRAGPAGARSLRSARLVGPPPADALHRAPVLRVSPARRALPSSLHAGAGRELQRAASCRTASCDRELVAGAILGRPAPELQLFDPARLL